MNKSIPVFHGQFIEGGPTKEQTLLSDVIPCDGNTVVASVLVSNIQAASTGVTFTLLGSYDGGQSWEEAGAWSASEFGHSDFLLNGAKFSHLRLQATASTNVKAIFNASIALSHQ